MNGSNSIVKAHRLGLAAKDRPETLVGYQFIRMGIEVPGTQFCTIKCQATHFFALPKQFLSQLLFRHVSEDENSPSDLALRFDGRGRHDGV